MSEYLYQIDKNDWDLVDDNGNHHDIIVEPQHHGPDFGDLILVGLVLGLLYAIFKGIALLCRTRAGKIAFATLVLVFCGTVLLALTTQPAVQPVKSEVTQSAAQPFHSDDPLVFDAGMILEWQGIKGRIITVTSSDVFVRWDNQPAAVIEYGRSEIGGLLNRGEFKEVW